MDKCFICLEYTKKSICPVSKCNIKCHSKCYNEYVNTLGKFDKCPKCKGVVKKYNLRTTFKKCNKEQCVNIIRRYLNEINETPSKQQKVELCKNMFEFLYINVWFLDSQGNFKNVVKKKLEHFYYYEKLSFVNYYHNKIFKYYL